MRKIIVCLIAALQFGSAYSQHQGKDKDELTAMMVYNIIKYVKWPALDQSFDVVVVGYPKLQSYLEKYFSGKTIHGVQARIVSGKKTDSTENVEILIVHNKPVVKQGTLSICIDDLDGMVNLVTESNDEVTRIKIKVRKKLSEDNGFQISASLIAMTDVID